MAKKPAAQSGLGGATRMAVFVGKDPFLIAERTASLKGALAGAHGEVETIRFDGAATPAADILDECRTFGLMQQHKLVIVDNADQFVKETNRPLVERYAENPADGATLLLRCERWYKGKLDKLIDGVGAVVSLEAPSSADAIAWTIAQCPARHGCAIERDAAAMLVDRLGADLGRIDMELAKLSLAVEGGRPITTREVAEGVGVTREEEVWEIKRTLLCGDASRILSHLRLILDNARRDAGVAVGYAMLDLARQIHAASRGLRSGVNPGVLIKDLRLWGASADLVLGAARKIEPRKASDLLLAAVEADVHSKSGIGEPGRNLEVLALRFASLA